MNKKSIIIIHGGDTYNTYDEYLEALRAFPVDETTLTSHQSWKDTLQKQLGDDYEVLRPTMPNKWNAKYQEWKIWFEKLLPFFPEEVVYVGHSLGGLFLAKYFSENIYSKKIAGLFLIAAPYDMADLESVADFELPASLETLSQQVATIYIYHSRDDQVVPLGEVEKYQKQLPNAKVRFFETDGHFRNELPQLITDIKALNS